MRDKNILKQLDKDEFDMVVTSGSDAGSKGSAPKPQEPQPEAAPAVSAPQVGGIRQHRKSQLIKLCVGCGIFIVLFVLVFVLMANLLNRDTVYDGVSLNGQSVSGLTQSELQAYIYNRYVLPLDNAQVVLEIDAQRKTYHAQDFLEVPDIYALSQRIFAEGRDGGVLSDLFSMYELQENPKDFEFAYKVRTEKFNEILALTESQQYISKLEPSYKIEEDQIVFTYGRDGLEINDDSLADTFQAFTVQLCQQFTAQETPAGGTYTVKVEPKKTEFRRILKISILNELLLESQDATFEKLSAKEMEIIPEIVAKAIDMEQLDAILARVNAGTERNETQEALPLPDDLVIFTKAFYERVNFRDTLGSGSNTNPEDTETGGGEDTSLARGENIQLTVNALNGILVLPGETFSFRDVLKELDQADFKKAYESYYGFDSPVLGGGISQVSSALYSAACKAGLTVGEVAHYTYAPMFVTPGLDAYISLSGKQDLTFVNAYQFPVRITATYRNRSIVVKVVGTVYRETDFPGIAEEDIPVTIQPTTKNELSAEIKPLNYKTVVTEDPALPEHSRVVTESGITGYIVDLYLVTTVEDDTSKWPLAQVTYKVRDEQVTEGTKSEE